MLNAMKTNMQKYPAYKDSGVEWLGEIPSHWDLTRLGTRFEERKTKVSDKDFPPLSVTKNGTIPQLDSAAKSNDGDNRKLVKTGDFVINSRSDRKGSSGIAYQDGSVSLIYIVMEPKGIHSIYCNYLLKSYNFIEEFYRMGHGIVADLWTTRYDEMKAIMVGIPSLEEQTAIADFLDRKTALIDQAIGIKHKQIELLKERRQILIHKAVTRGLNPNVKMKDSGVEWIGEIPEHWELFFMNYAINAIADVDHYMPTTIESGVPYVMTGDLKDFASDIDFEGCKKVSQRDYFNLSKKIKSSLGDVILARYATIGTASYVNINLNFIVSYSCVTIKSNPSKLLGLYLFYYFKSDAFATDIKNQVNTNTQGNVGIGNLKKVKLVIPPINEQIEIAQHIEIVTSKIATAISLKEQEIEKLKEYKATLINSAVTGKIKVS
jgi:type I restriction enzyme S subunit